MNNFLDDSPYGTAHSQSDADWTDSWVEWMCKREEAELIKAKQKEEAE